MVLLFFAVGLEIRRELAMGELTDRRRLRIPVIAALAGLVIPAGIFLLLNPSGEAAAGWGAAISTDTALVLGVLALAGSAVPTQLRVFLLTLSVVDDVAALIIIAFFYSDDVSVLPLAIAAGATIVILALGRLNVWRGPAYFVAGVVLWLAMLESGVHPAIAGVVIALCIPTYPPERVEVERAASLAARFRQSPMPSLARTAKLSLERAVSPNERMQELLLPWTGFVIVPVFALANAGVVIDADSLRGAFTSSLGLGIILGLVVGKLVGVGLVTLAVARSGIADLPRGAGPLEVIAGAALTGIGFTVSLFIVDLAFTDPELIQEAKIAVMAASVIAAVLGWSLFRLAAVRAARQGRAVGAPRLHSGCRPRARPHPRRAGRAAHAGGVLRLRVPVLQQHHRDPGPVARAVRRRPALRLPPPAAHRCARERRGRGPRRRGGGAAGALLGDARPAVRPPGPAAAGRPRGPR